MSQPQGWPAAELDAVRRLRVLASTRGGLYAEGVIAAPFEQVWAVAGDLEGKLPNSRPTYAPCASPPPPATGSRRLPATGSACAHASTGCCGQAGVCCRAAS